LHALLGCSVLAEDAIRSAIDDWKEKHGLPVEHREPVAEHDH
jgi:NifU-like protein involved in Fe-S cluster formation